MAQQDWLTTQLGNVATLQRGFDLPTRLRRRGTVPIVSSSGVSGWHDHAMVQAPGVVTGRYGTIGEVFLQLQDFWPLNTTLWVSDFHGNDETFIYYFLQRIDFSTHSGKSGVPGVNRNDLHTELVSIPTDVKEQRRIAEALSDADSLIVELERLIAKKHSIMQGMMQQLLTARTRLTGFTDEWKTKSLEEDVTLISGHHVLSQNYNISGRGIPYLTGPSDFPNGRIRQTKFTDKPTSMCEAGDILVTVKGSGAGTLVMTDASYCISRQLMAIRTKAWDSRFLLYSLLQNARNIKDAVTGLIPGLSRSDILNQAIPIPFMSEQQAIAAVLADTNAELDALDARLVKARYIKQGMMQQLLTGRTRLPVEGAV
jgi:type I restriction enzyme, S subunit